MAEMMIDDETLMAFADGELAPAEAAAVAAAVARDPALARRVEMFAGSRAALAQDAARGPDPVPAALQARIEALLDAAPAADPAPDNVVPLRRPARPPARPLWGLATAASLALAVGLGTGFLAGRTGGGGGEGLGLPVLAHAGLDAALDRLPAGSRDRLEDGSEVEVIASFLNADGELCREFELDEPGGSTAVSVACHGGADWQVRLAVVTATAGADGYAPVSSLDTLEAFLSSSGAGPALSPADEAAALGALAGR